MPNTRSAKKEMRKAEKRRIRNRYYRSRARTYIKRVRKLLGEGRIEEAREALRLAVKALDKAAQKGVIHKNNAARRKSRLMRLFNKYAVQASAET
ncbi:MAG: 30S ribosomal protein S20 [Chloroflexi bacterium]|nr:MAG: 30S ribosomal protein S20 [Chloroflexota bacterium]HDN78931.1 30S ribosomal protein S20 [Chloroflexota bacterium]